MSSTVVLASQPGSAVHDLRTKPWSTSLPMRQCGQTSETPLQTMRCHPRTPTPPRCNDSPQLSRLWFPVHSSSMGSRTVKLTASWSSGWSTALLRSGRWWQPCRKNSPAHCGVSRLMHALLHVQSDSVAWSLRHLLEDVRPEERHDGQRRSPTRASCPEQL